MVLDATTLGGWPGYDCDSSTWSSELGNREKVVNPS